MAPNLPPCPANLKPIQHFLKLANEHDSRDPVVSYWCRLTALQTGLGLDKSSKEALAVLLPLMEWLEAEKNSHKENDAITNEVVASAHIENYAMKLFLAADQADRAGNFGKNVVKSFYSAGILFDVMPTFGEVTPEVAHYRKYSKMKAAYIHNCLKNGETPIAGPLVGEEEEDAPEANVQPVPPPHLQPSQPPEAHFQPYAPRPQDPSPAPPAQQFSSMDLGQPTSSGGSTLSYDQITRAQKLCKFAISALDYQDTATAIDNLNKAIHLCKTGQEMP